MITKTPPSHLEKFTGVGEDAATGQTAVVLGYCSPHSRKPRKSQTHPVVSSQGAATEHSPALTMQCIWCLRAFNVTGWIFHSLGVGQEDSKGKTLKKKTNPSECMGGKKLP